MCFSMKFSFLAAAGLGVMGAYTFKKSLGNKRLQPLAAIPIWFAIQQFFEGLVWVSFSLEPTFYSLRYLSAYCFLYFAFIFWPTYIPVAFLYAENSIRQLKPLYFLCILGAFVSLAGLVLLIRVPLLIGVFECSINYSFELMERFVSSKFYLMVYAIATIMPFFITSLVRSRMLGSGVLFGLLVSYFFWNYVLISVWCFFAALVSFFVYFIVRDSSL